MTHDHTRIKELAAAYTAAWNSGSPDAVASFYAPDGQIVINRGEPSVGRKGVSVMAAGFFADVPDLRLVCDDVRCAGGHVAYFWTFTGTHAVTGNPLCVVGWEEWDLDADCQIVASRGWFDAADYERQTNAKRSRT
ncbi:MAG: SgcJ/EcaC family oxidoreductase [Pseudomonadales bacterium]